MRRFLLMIVLSALVVSPGAGGAADSEKGRTESWVGKSRDEVVASWGPPKRVKQRRDGRQVLFYEVEAYLRDAYGGEEYGSSFTVERDDEGRRRGRREEEGQPPEPLYKKLKFKFHLDRTGRVERFDGPAGAQRIRWTPPQPEPVDP